MKTDILIAGSGCSGLYCALQLPRDKKITIITKSDLTSNDSFLAQDVAYTDEIGLDAMIAEMNADLTK